MKEKWEELYELLVHQICLLCFGVEERNTLPHKALVEAWMQQNGMGPDDWKVWFDK